MAARTSATTALLTGGLMCLLAVLAVAVRTPELRDGGAVTPDGR
ncbi:hypothetical protein [Streptomyces sp. NPDC005799]